MVARAAEPMSVPRTDPTATRALANVTRTERRDNAPLVATIREWMAAKALPDGAMGARRADG